jgi:hypothetical protein
MRGNAVVFGHGLEKESRGPLSRLRHYENVTRGLLGHATAWKLSRFEPLACKSHHIFYDEDIPTTGWKASYEPLTEMGITRNPVGRRGRQTRKADNLTAV